MLGNLLPQLWLLITAAVALAQATYGSEYTGIKTKIYRQDSQAAQTFDNYQPQTQSYHPTYQAASLDATNAQRLAPAHQHYATAPTTQTQQYASHAHDDYYGQRELPLYERNGHANQPSAQLAYGRDTNRNTGSVSASASGSSNWQNAETDVTNYYTGCPAGHTGPVPYAYDCRRFVNCWHGRGHIQSCGPGTVFNPETLECDRPDKVACGALNALSALHTAGTGGAQGTSTAKYRAGRLLDSGTENVNVLCPHGVMGLQPHPTDCAKFVNCANGNVHVQDCGPGTAFSPTQQVCDFKDKVDCSGREGRVLGANGASYQQPGRQQQGAQHAGNVACPTGVLGLYPHPHDCTKFLNCAHGQMVVQSCGPGTAFDRVKLVCDYPEHVNCAGRAGRGTTASNQQEAGNIFCPIGVTGFFAYPFDYTRFLNCKKGNTAIQNCRADSVFSIALGHCDQRDKVRWTDHVTYIVSQVSYEYSYYVATCPPSTDGLHLYPFDCTKYVKCSGQLMQILQCEPEHVFSISRRSCAPARQVADTDRVKYLTEITETMTMSTATALSQNYDSQKVQCPVGHGQAMGYFPHPFDCTKYLQCVHGKLIVEICASGSVFSISKKRCEPRANVAERDKVQFQVDYAQNWNLEMNYDYTNFDHGTVSLVCPPNVNGFFLHPFDCTKYLICHDGQTKIDSCSAGFVFSISQRKCIIRDQVEAYDRVEYLTETQNEFSSESDLYNKSRSNAVSCPYGATGVYPHPHDATKYLTCTDGRTTVESCAPSKVFSISRRYCEYTYRVDAYDRGDYVGSTDSVTAVHANTHTSRKESDLEVSCPPGAEGMYPHPSDCTKFLTCTKRDTVIEDCAPGTAWSIEMEICDNIANVECGNRRLSIVHTQSTQVGSAGAHGDRLMCPPGVSGFYVHPFDATRYFSCSSGATSIQTCDDGSIYSISRRMCLPERAVQSADRVAYVREIIVEITVTATQQLGYIVCPRAASGAYVYPFDCGKYIRCDNGYTTIESCAPGSVYSIARRYCIAQEQAESGDRVGYARDLQYAAGWQSGHGQVATTATSSFATQGHAAECPPGANGLHAHPFDCKKFLNCANGITHIQDCGPGTAWSVEAQMCDFEHKVDCSDRFASGREGKAFGSASRDYEQVACPAGETGLHPHPYDCTKFLNCANGVTHVQNCGPGTAWDAKMEVCDLIANVDCGNRNGVGTSTDYSDRDAQSHSYGGSHNTQQGYGQSSSNVGTWQQGQYGHTQHHAPSYNNQQHGYDQSASTSSTATGTGTHGYRDRWSNMDVQRPVGSTYGQEHAGTYDQTAQHTQSTGWSGVGSVIDRQTPTHNVVYAEGSLEPNRNYHSVKTYATPLAPFSPNNVAAATNRTTFTSTMTAAGKTHTNADTNTNTNIYYAQPVGSDEDSEEVFDNTAKDDLYATRTRHTSVVATNDRHNYDREISSSVNSWIPIPNQNLMPPRPSNALHPEQDSIHTQTNTQTVEAPKTHLMPPLRTNAEPGQQPLLEEYIPNPTNDESNLYGGLQPPLPSSVPNTNNPNYPTQNENPRDSLPYGSRSRAEPKPPATHLMPPLPSNGNHNALVESHTPSTPIDASNLYGGMQPPFLPSASPIPTPLYNIQTTTPSSYLRQPTYSTTPMHPSSSATTRLTNIHTPYTHPLLSNATQTKTFSDPHYSPSYSNVAHFHNSTWSNSGVKTSYNPQHQDELPVINEALRMLLRPYFNRSGTVSESAAAQAESHIMNLMPTPTPTPTNRDPNTLHTDKSVTEITNAGAIDQNEKDVELIIAGEQHSLTTIPIQNGTRETRTEFYAHRDTQTDQNSNRHYHGHSREFHLRHPNLPNPYTENERSSASPAATHHSTHHHHAHSHPHSREFHLRHPELPNPYATTSTGVESLAGTEQVGATNPYAEPTTPSGPYGGIDLRMDCEFDCGNGKCAYAYQVCNGVNDCGNRKDESHCEHLGYEVRLTGSDSPNMGRIEVKILGKWGYVCDDKFGLLDADVVCRELGFDMGASEVRGNSYYPPLASTVSFAMDEVDCLGNETSLKECNFKGWGVSNCQPDEVVGVVCKVPLLKCPNNYWLCSTSKECIPPAFVCDNTPDCADRSDESDRVCNSPIKYRLDGGRSENEGRLEVKYRSEWGTVCDDDFGMKEAIVACNSLGFYGKPKIEKNIFGPGSGPIWLDQVSCVGNETSLDKCNHWSWGEHNCNHTEDVGLRCTVGPQHGAGYESQFGFDVQQQLPDDNQNMLEDIGFYSMALERSSKSFSAVEPRLCGQFKSDLPDEFEHPEERVINGNKAKRGRFPWQATIRTRGRGGISSHWCGAVLISKQHLLTAAHCLSGYAKGAYFVRMGDHYANIAESSEVDSYIENWYVHEKFREKTHMNNDIALVVLKTPVHFNDYIQPVCLPPKGAALEVNRTCTISGWGSIKSGVSTPSNVLRSAQLPILADDTCSQPHVYGATLTEGMFCAGYMDERADACDGDSGGPLVCTDAGGETLYGIISWGQHCGYANKPGVYVRVEKYIDWIYEKINFSLKRNSS